MLERSEPAVGSVVAAAPSELRLHYSEGVGAAFVTLTDDHGTQIALGAPHTAPDAPLVVIVPIEGSLPDGEYRVKWRVLSVDTHVTQGDFGFRVVSGGR
jgi:methionine-rich copper-binding protein CopC